LTDVRILRRSIDSRQRVTYIELTVRLFIGEQPEEEHLIPPPLRDVSAAPPVVIVGAGPAGLFAALRLIDNGLRPILIERGKDIHERKKDLAQIARKGVVDSDSNYAFGEGGAGAFSDGKLHTRSHKRGPVVSVFRTFCHFGANPDILIDAHPHIGSDKLPPIIEHIRKYILQCGGQVHFRTRMESLIIRENVVTGVCTADGQEFHGPVILAVGHSAADVYRYLDTLPIALEPKPLAIGLRIEHPQEVIDRLRYHRPDGRGPYLPPAEYTFATQVDGRGVYTFCMCPGGFVIPAATESGQLVVNGLSSERRNSPYAHAAGVVKVHPDDIPAPYSGALSVLHYREYLERLAWEQGGKTQTAPAQRLTDFCQAKLSPNLPATSYAPGVVSSPIHRWLPRHISGRIRAAILRFDRINPGFLSPEATIIAIESRTSSPLRIPRHPTLGYVPTLPGLFPAGEGAGQAGGIVSAALDGLRAAEAVTQFYSKPT
jgi:uncharacterized FAD-dependent dehydrogenase